MRRKLYAHQVKALDMLRQSIGQGKRRPMLQAPTGLKNGTRRGRR
jgi:hypothetical protein